MMYVNMNWKKFFETKYRVQKREPGLFDMLATVAFIWLIAIFGSEEHNYYVQYKMWWWPFWLDYRRNGEVVYFKTMTEGKNYIELIKDGSTDKQKV